MKLQRIAEQVYGKPWLITPQAHASIRTLIETKLNDATSVPAGAGRPDRDLFGDPIAKMQITEDVALIPIHGVIGNKLGRLEKSCGACGLEDIHADISEALRQRCSTIVFDIDSPGGSVGGTPELADTIAGLRKKGVKTLAVTTGMCASAAYWLAASADKIFATKTADVGSIGVYMAVVDERERFERAGLKVDVIKSGALKGIGIPGTSLTSEQRSYLQGEVDSIYKMFTAHVTAHRRGVKADSMQGQTFMGSQAEARGLIDRVVGSVQEVVFDATLAKYGVKKGLQASVAPIAAPTVDATLSPLQRVERVFARQLASRKSGRTAEEIRMDDKFNEEIKKLSNKGK